MQSSLHSGEVVQTRDVTVVAPSPTRQNESVAWTPTCDLRLLLKLFAQKSHVIDTQTAKQRVCCFQSRSTYPLANSVSLGVLLCAPNATVQPCASEQFVSCADGVVEASWMVISPGFCCKIMSCHARRDYRCTLARRWEHWASLSTRSAEYSPRRHTTTDATMRRLPIPFLNCSPPMRPPTRLRLEFAERRKDVRCVGRRECGVRLHHQLLARPQALRGVPSAD